MAKQTYRKPEPPHVRGQCLACGERPQSAKGKGKYRPTCRSCHAKRFGLTEKPKTPATLRRRRYGLSAADYDALLVQQDGRCPICTEPMDPPFVDHCHDTGRVRGLLCRDCNLGLGKFKDDATRVERALDYLRRGG